MIQLPLGCSCSAIKVIPKNWNSVNATLKKSWFIYYRFHDPNFKSIFPKGKLKIIKGGINNLKTLGERRHAVKELLKVEKALLEEQGYNPILNKKAGLPNSDYIIAPFTGFANALQLAFQRLEKQPSTISDIKSVIKVVTQASTNLGMQDTPICDIKRRHIISMLDLCQRMNDNWSANRYNKCKAYLSVIFNELVRIESITENPVTGIAKKKTVHNIRETLTLEQRKTVNQFLKENYYDFWRFLQIFFHSGARETELMKIRKDDVNLMEQYFIVTVFKRNMPERTKRPIKHIVYHLWKEIHETAKAGEYLFGKGLLPGRVPISPSQVSRRWRTHIKLKLGITADFYSLKHLNLDETAAILDIESAAKMAGHTSTVITAKHYALNEEKRSLEKLKSVNNNFG